MEGSDCGAGGASEIASSAILSIKGPTFNSVCFQNEAIMVN